MGQAPQSKLAEILGGSCLLYCIYYPRAEGGDQMNSIPSIPKKPHYDHKKLCSKLFSIEQEAS